MFLQLQWCYLTIKSSSLENVTRQINLIPLNLIFLNMELSKAASLTPGHLPCDPVFLWDLWYALSSSEGAEKLPGVIHLY